MQRRNLKTFFFLQRNIRSLKNNIQPQPGTWNLSKRVTTVKPEILAAIIFSVLLRLYILAAINIGVLKVVVMITLKALTCNPSAKFAYNYSINVLSKYSSIISHRPSMFEGRHINHRSSKDNTSIINLRRSTHRSPKVDTSIFESRHIDLRMLTHRLSIFKGRHIDLRKSTHHQSSKVDTSIFEDQKQKHHTYNSSPNIIHNGAP